MKLNMKYIKSFNENLNQSFNYSDKEITGFIDWVIKNCTEALRFTCQHHKSGFDDIPDYYTWFFNRSYYSSTEEYIKNWRKRRTTFDLYETWYKEQNDETLIKPTTKQHLDNDFVPVNFLEYLGGNNYWLYRSNFNGVEQPSYWTKGNNARGKFTLEELFNEFNSK
jgi:hypothetical protein